MSKKIKKFFLLLLRRLKKLIPTHLSSEAVSAFKYFLDVLVYKARELKDVPIEDLLWLFISVTVFAATVTILIFLILLFFI